jgi:hypothetical protein
MSDADLDKAIADREEFIAEHEAKMAELGTTQNEVAGLEIEKEVSETLGWRTAL